MEVPEPVLVPDRGFVGVDAAQNRPGGHLGSRLIIGADHAGSLHRDHRFLPEENALHGDGLGHALGVDGLGGVVVPGAAENLEGHVDQKKHRQNRRRNPNDPNPQFSPSSPELLRMEMGRTGMMVDTACL